MRHRQNGRALSTDNEFRPILPSPADCERFALHKIVVTAKHGTNLLPIVVEVFGDVGMILRRMIRSTSALFSAPISQAWPIRWSRSISHSRRSLIEAKAPWAAGRFGLFGDFAQFTGIGRKFLKAKRRRSAVSRSAMDRSAVFIVPRMYRFAGNGKFLARMRQRHSDLIRFAFALVIFQQCDEFAHDLRDVGAVDLVNDKNIG